MTDYTEVARQAYGDVAPWPVPPRQVEDVRPYLLRTLELLPAADQIGYCKAPPGGENSITLPDGTLVRVGRVCWPNGQIVKIMFDVPNGGPQWVEEDVQPALYHPYADDHEPPDPEPPPDDELAERVTALEQQAKMQALINKGLQDQITELAKQISDLHQLFVPKPLPTYIGRLFGFTIRSNPE